MSGTEKWDEVATLEGQYVTFSVANEAYAVPLAPVQEIIRAPQVAQLPLAPAALSGLANLRGRVLPILDLRKAFGLPARPLDEATRAVVLQVGQPLGLLVDEVRRVIRVHAEEIQPVAQIQSVARSELLTGVIQRPRCEGPGDELILVLDFDRVIRDQFSRLAASAAAPGAIQIGSEAPTLETKEVSSLSDELRLVSFTVAGQEYGIDIKEVREIVQCPETYTEIPNAAPHVLGLMSLRQRLLPLVGLRRLFTIPEVERDERQRVVVVALPDGGTLGLLTDTVKEVLSVPADAAKPVPSLLASDETMREFTAICSLDEGRRLLSILAIPKLPGMSDLIDVVNANQATDANISEEEIMTSLSSSQIAARQEDAQVVVFRLGGEEYGVPIMSVQEIVRVPDVLTRVPRTPDYAEGVINLRGTVLPVIDQRRSMGLPPCERNDRQRIMVYNVGQRRTGFIVDSVAEVMRISAANIESAPDLSEEQTLLISEVAKLEDGRRLVMLVQPEQLVTLAHTTKINPAEVADVTEVVNVPPMEMPASKLQMAA